MPARLVIDGMRTRRYLTAGKSLAASHITGRTCLSTALSSQSMYLAASPSMVRDLAVVGESLRQCGSVLIRTSVPCFGVPRYQLAGRPVRPNFILQTGPKALEAHSFSLLKRPLPQPPTAGLGETAICLIVCRMKPGT